MPKCAREAASSSDSSLCCPARERESALARGRWASSCAWGRACGVGVAGVNFMYSPEVLRRTMTPPLILPSHLEKHRLLTL